MASLGDMVVRIVGDVTDLNKSIDVAHSKFQAATSNFQKLGANLTKFVTLPILGIGAAAVKSAADMEIQEAAFTTLLGSAERAKGMLDDLAALAAKTPFEMPDLAEASRTMLSFGIEAEKILPNLRMLGDISGGNADKLKSLTLAFSQIQSTGRLMGQDLLQLINAGFNPLTIIAQKTGKSMAELKKEMEQGAISAEQVADAFKAATSEGGLFYQGSERASKTLTGQISTLLDDLKTLGRSIGNILLPAIKNTVAGISSWVKGFTDLDDGTKKLIIGMSLVVASVGPVISITLSLIKTFGAIKLLLAATGPGSIIAGLAGLGAAPIMAGLSALAIAIGLIAAGLKKAKVEAESTEKAISAVATISEYETAIKAQQAVVARAEGALSGYAPGTPAYKGLEIALKKEQDKLDLMWENLRAARLKVELDRLDALEQERAAEAEINRLSERARLGPKIKSDEEDRGDELERQVGLHRDAKNAYVDMGKAAEQTERVAKKARENEKKDIGDIAKLRKEANAAAYSSALQLASALQQLGENLSTAEVNRLEAQKEKEIELAGEDAAAREKIETDYAKRIGDLKYKAAIGSWELSLATATADAVSAVIKTMASIPYPLNLLPAGLQTAAGIAQIAALVAAKPQRTNFADGGVVMPQPGGLAATVAEAGKAEAIIPLDRLDQMLSRASGMNSDGGMQHLVVNLDSRPLLDKIFDATRNRTVLISAGAVV